MITSYKECNYIYITTTGYINYLKSQGYEFFPGDDNFTHIFSRGDDVYIYIPKIAKWLEFLTLKKYSILKLIS